MTPTINATTIASPINLPASKAAESAGVCCEGAIVKGGADPNWTFA
jgi:hypothetical protein